MLTPKEALNLLDQHAPPGEEWPLHCRQVAKVAVTVATALPDTAPEFSQEELQTQALLHDIGRSKTHGPMHGWSGFTLLRSLGHADAGRGCLTHWLKGRTPEDLLATGHFEEKWIAQVFSSLQPPEWTLTDTLLSFADSCVKHTTIVPLAERHADLFARYGESIWMTRAQQLAQGHADALSDLFQHDVEDILRPLHGDTLKHA